MKVLAIGGEPATGKSTLMKAFAAGLLQVPAPQSFAFGLLRGTHYPSCNLFLVGLYPQGDVFGGTDKLSMAVQPDAEKFIVQMEMQRPDCRVVFEGDRLFNQRFLETVQKVPGVELHALLLVADAEHLAARHVARRDSQNEKFLKGRATKYRNIAGACPWVQYCRNENFTQQQAILRLMHERLGL